MPAWTRPRALVALRYHTRVLLSLLQKLDLPFNALLELRLGRQRSRPSAFGLGPGRAETSGRRWHATAWGGLFLSLEACCRLWRWRGPPPPFGDGVGDCAALGGSEYECYSFCSFSCLSPADASLIAEAEAQTCASLRHLARACPPAWPVCTGRGAAPAIRPVATDAAAPLAGLPLTPDFAARAEELLDAAWAFFLRTRLTDAIIRGDLLGAGAWAMRCLGLGQPWSLRRLHEFVVLVLELLSEGLDPKSPGDMVDVGGAGVGAGALWFFCEAGACYVGIPVIPRLEARLHRCLVGLADKTSKLVQLATLHAPEHREALDGFLATIATLASATKVVGNFGGPDFSATLRKLRAGDALHVAFSRGLAEGVFEHNDAQSCPLDAAVVVAAGAEAAVELCGGAAWPSERRSRLMSALACLEGPDLEDFEEQSPRALSLDDVSVEGLR